MALERFEFTVELYNISRVHEWIHRTVRTITSPLFNELVIWILHMTHCRSLVSAMNADGWKAMDASLGVLAERNPGFGVTFRGNLIGIRGRGNFDASRRHIESDCLPLTSLKGFVKFESVSDAENRFQKMGVV